MKANRRACRRTDEGGQLLLLSGIVLVLAFIVTALTLTSLAGLEKAAAEEQEVRILTDFRFLREKVGSTLHDAVGPSTDNATFNDVFANMVATFKVVMQEKGYDVVIKKAAGPEKLALSEWSFTQDGYPTRDAGSAIDEPQSVPPTNTNASAYYHLRAHDNTIILQNGHEPDSNEWRRWDRSNDGIVWTKPCKRDVNGCIQAAIIYIYLADSTTSIEEFVVYGFNLPTP